MLRYKFIRKLLVIEYTIMLVILIGALFFKCVTEIKVLEELNNQRQQTIVTLLQMLDKRNEKGTKNVEAAIIEEDVKEPEIIQTKSIKQNKGKFRITAYCACEKCCGKWAVANGGGITASGTRVKEGRTIAVYKSQIPFGTEVYIEGMGTYIAEDTGSAIKENCIDVYFDSHEEAWNFGVKYLNVEW